MRHSPIHRPERRRRRTKPILAVALGAAIVLGAWYAISRRASAESADPRPVAHTAGDHVALRRRADFAAMETFRSGYAFWRHVFTLPDGWIAFGSAADGRLLAMFPAKGNWTRDGVWLEPSLAGVLDGQPLPRNLRQRRARVALLLEAAAGPVVHNATRGDALRQNAPRYGRFLAEWGAIYQRFGVPPDIGLAQVILESGLSGTRRSEANAIGFCQWLRSNWQRLTYFSPVVIEAHNQTTQAPYCAAYLSVLAAKYGSFIPAVSEHNAGGTNVGRALINGAHLGARDVRARYFLGSKLALDLRALNGREYRAVHRTYGPRSYFYAEMVFGNASTVRSLTASMEQVPIYAMRTPRTISLTEIMRRTGLPASEVRRFNPALVERVRPQATLYLPFHVSEFGPDVAFWRRPASTSYATVLDDFMRLEPGPERWDDPAFAPVLTEFRRRFRQTNTEEGSVMDTVLAYAMDQAYTSGRRELLGQFRSDEQVRRLITRGLLELDTLSGATSDLSLP